jgi:hypothetical protein
MKIVLSLFLIFFAAACSKSAGTTTERLDEQLSASAIVQTQTMPGVFVSNGQNVSGTATIFNQNGQLSLLLKDFSTNNGPDLHVYLSQERQPVHFIDLGRLKSTMGNQVYTITGMPDFSTYQFALIHCQQYNHLFGSAELAK